MSRRKRRGQAPPAGGRRELETTKADISVALRTLKALPQSSRPGRESLANGADVTPAAAPHAGAKPARKRAPSSLTEIPEDEVTPSSLGRPTEDEETDLIEPARDVVYARDIESRVRDLVSTERGKLINAVVALTVTLIAVVVSAALSVSADLRGQLRDSLTDFRSEIRARLDAVDRSTNNLGERLRALEGDSTQFPVP